MSYYGTRWARLERAPEPPATGTFGSRVYEAGDGRRVVEPCVPCEGRGWVVGLAGENDRALTPWTLEVPLRLEGEQLTFFVPVTCARCKGGGCVSRLLK